MKEKAGKYSVQLCFEEVKLPPFEDVMILGNKSCYGKIGVFKSFEMLEPNGFEMFEVEDENVGAVFINRKILNKISRERILRILKNRVFPFVSCEEIIKVNFNLKLILDTFEEEF